MALLENKVAIVTGGGRGLGRSHALALAREGAAVVVNDPGFTLAGTPSDERPADAVVREIHAAGGRAVANYADCADWAGAQSLVEDALANFGRLDVLVNNAGIIRDRMSFNMGEAEFDAVVRVHLKGHFAPSHHAAHYWRSEAKAGRPVSGRIINTTSEAGLWGNPGQVNYAAAKAGIVGMTLVMARELQSSNVTVNAISPRGATRFTGSVPGAEGQSERDAAMPVEQVSPLVVHLASNAGGGITGQVFVVYGRYLALSGWVGPIEEIEHPTGWTLADIPAAVDRLFAAHSRVPVPLEVARDRAKPPAVG